tara:strand:- start:2542 stop:2688 length:147 start_codon:yes stop_codon:yes gene_type:complete
VAAILVQEAGGRVTHLNGAPLELIDGCDVLFSSGYHHEEIVAAFKPQK